ncbi:MAG: DUF58 domain-containing protein [Pyrinomonadaceae bacterium]|nr:DUF58 domain-containing protein [Pyrinomonadaceae bacterium]
MKNAEEKSSSGKTATQSISFRDIRNAVFGLITVIGGLALAIVTLWAHQTGNPQLAGGAAVASLVFVVLILLFVIPPLARNASKEVSQFDLPLELTTGGLIFLGIVVIVGFAAWNTGNNLLFLVLAFLLAALFVSLVLGSSNLKKLEAKMRFPEAIHVDEPTSFFVALNNRKWLFPSFSVLLTLRGALSEDPFGGRRFKLIKPPKSFAKFLRLPYIKRHVGYFLHVSRRAEAEQQTEQIFTQRGRFIIKDFELTTRFPFGFWLQRKRLNVKETEVFVFPKLSDVREFLPTNTRQIGQFASNRRGSGQDLLTLRDYQTADDVRRVDWKATARTGNVIVRDYTAEDERKITIVFDTKLPKVEAPNAK